MPDNIVDLKVGIGADISQLVTDLKDAEKKIAALGSEPVKITITPELDVKSFVSQIQKAVGKQATKVSVGSAESKGASTTKPKIDITDATGQLAILERRMEEIKKVAGNIDVGHKINVDPKGDITGAVIRYTNALGQAVSESYKLIETFDDAGEVIDREFRAMGETMSDSTTKVARFKESIRGVEIALESFATKNTDIGDQIGLKELISDFDVLKSDTNAEVVALQRFKNEFNAVKVKADEMRAAQKAQARDSKDEEKITSLQRQLDLQQAIKAVRSGDVEEMQRQLVLLGQMERLVRKDLDDSDVSVQLQAQRQINEIYKQREQIVAANAAHEKQTSNEKAAIERQTAAGQREAARERAAIERQSLRDQTSFQQTINQLKSVSSSSLVNEQRKITDLYKKQLEYINRRIATEKALNTSGSKQARIALQYQKATLRTVTYKAKLATYAKDVADQITRAKNNMSGLQGYSRSTANIFKGIILSQTFYNAVGFLRNLVNEAWELSVALNTSEAVFTGMLTGGQEQARGLLEVLKQEAINTPFDINNLLQATRLLTAYGIQAKNLMYVMRAVEKATAVSGDPVRMEYISRAIGQIYTKGKLQAEEVRQLTESGIAVGEILADELNLTQEQIAQGWGKLNIDANTAINAIVRGIDKRYGQALDNMARTTAQKLNNMKESFALITSSMTDPIRRGIDTVIDIITPKIEQLYQAIQAVGLGNALKSLIPERLYNSVLTVINKIVSAFQILKIVIQQLKPVLEVLFNAFAWRLNVIYNVFTTILAVLGMVGNAFGGSAKGLALLESGLKRVMGLMLAYKAVMLLVAAVSKIWNVVSIMLRGVIIAVQGVIVAVKGLAAIMGAAGMASASAWLPVIGVLLTITGLVAALAGSLGSVTAAAKRVGAALKNMGGGTSLGDMFENVSSSLQSSVDAYNAEVAKQNESMNNALIEGSNDQTTAVENAGGATEKAMKGLMSFDEVYKLNEASAGGGGGGAEAIPVEIDGFTLPATGGLFDSVGGVAEDFFNDLNLDELQNALGDLWSEVRPLLDDVLFYVMKMVGYFAEMHLKAKLMTSENKEQWTLEKQQTSEDTEQAAKEKQQTSEDTEQAAKEKAQTSEDTEQLAREKSQTTEDTEQLAKEKSQTSEDTEQLAKEKSQTSEDMEQLVKEKSQTSEDSEQLVNEKLQTAEDKEQLINEKLQTAEDKEQWVITKTGRTGGTGQAGTAAALALINIAQIGSSAKMLVDDIKTLREGGAELSDWMSLFVNGLMMAVDVLQLFGAFKLIKGAVGGAGAAAAAGAGTAVAGNVVGGAATAGGAAAGGAAIAATGGVAAAIVAATAGIALGIRSIAENEDTAYNNLNKFNEMKKESMGLSQSRSDLLEDEKTLVALLAQAESEQAEAKIRLDKTGNAIDYATYKEREARTEEIRALLEQNSLDIEGYSDAVNGYGESSVDAFQTTAEAAAKRAKEMKELLEKQQEAYHQYYTDVENLTRTYQNNLNDISIEGYAQSNTSMEDWLTGMTKRQKQEYEYQENLARLKGRDIPAGMLEELEASGPQYSALIKELADANDDDLGEVVGVWEENAKLARQMALDKLGPMPEDARNLLKRYRFATDEELEKLVDSYAEQHKLSREEAVEELSGLTGDTEKIIKETTDYVEGEGAKSYKDAFNKLGGEGPKGLLAKKINAINASGEIADAVVDEAGKRKSSMKGVGDDAGEAYSRGVKDNKKGSGEAGDELAQSAIDSAKSTAIISAWMKAGSDSYKSYIGGLEIGHTKASDAGKELANKAKSGMDTVSMYSSGSNAGQTFIDGLNGKSAAIKIAFKTVLNSLLSSMEIFTDRVATTLNTTLSRVASTMSSVSTSSSGKVSFTKMSGVKVTAMANGGVIHRAARGVQLLRKPTMLTSNTEGGEAGDEIVFPLENTSFIQSFAEKIAEEISDVNMQASARSLNAQMKQAKAGATQAITLSSASADDISNAIRSWFTPQMQSLHNVLEEDRTVEVTVPNTSNALWRTILSELKAVNESAGSRGLSVVGR